MRPFGHAKNNRTLGGGAFAAPRLEGEDDAMPRMKTFCDSLQRLAASLAIAALFATVSAAQEMDRTILPIQPPQRKAITELDARKATKPPRFEVNAPQ